MPSAQLNNGLPLDAKQIVDFPIYRPENAPTPYNRRTAIEMEPDLGLNWAAAVFSPSGPVSNDTGYFSTIFRHCPKSFFEQTARVWQRAHQQFISPHFRTETPVENYASPHQHGTHQRELSQIARISKPRCNGSKLTILLDLKRYVTAVHEAVSQVRDVVGIAEHIPAAVILTRFATTNLMRSALRDDTNVRVPFSAIREQTFQSMQAVLRVEMTSSDSRSWLASHDLGQPRETWHGVRPIDHFFRTVRRLIVGDNWDGILAGEIPGTLSFYFTQPDLRRPTDAFPHRNLEALERVSPREHNFYSDLVERIETNDRLRDELDLDVRQRRELVRDVHASEMRVRRVDRLSNPPIVPRIVPRIVPLEQLQRTAPEPPKNPLDDLAPEPKLLETTPQALVDVCTCPITYEIMRDPVIDPEGNSFERVAIISALKKNPKSPITRTPLNPKQLIENRALKQTIQALTASS